ncbi:hypothetical protein VB264_14520 [Arcicella aquatica]|uniref:DUF4276 family protein n=1 Tax=Arcicella aquatica TaxID=217141 RepID=A0ABU5QPK1_9BACT|nr:hypothetical protein [Arcicella aquatica]MEA5259007.1 hypothetical protein [Arcicella aquatica]
MVRIGFIVEGETEALILYSDKFKAILNELNLVSVGIINAGGNKNLLPHNILIHQSNLIKKGAETIVILTDLDEDQCITKTKARITERENQIIIVAIKQIESWFLADSLLLSNLFNEPFSFDYPENENVPFDTLRALLIKYRGRGLPKKIPMALKMINSGFSIEHAANHPNCPSANYFLTKLKQCASTNPVE